MPRLNLLLTLITGGEWRKVGNNWSYEGERVPKAIMVTDTIKFDALKNKITEKLVVDHERYQLCMKYLSPLSQNLPPFDINDDDDLEAFKFLSIKSAKDGVLAIEIYTSLKLKYNDSMDGFEEKPFTYEAETNLHEMNVPLTAPHISQGQSLVVKGGIMQDERTLDEILEVEKNRSATKDDAKSKTECYRKWFCKKSAKPNVVSLSSDDEEVMFTARHMSSKLIIVPDDDEEEENYVANKDSRDDMDSDFVGAIEEAEQRYYSTHGMKDEWSKFKDEDAVVGVNGRNEIRAGDFFQSKKELQDAVTSVALRDCFELKVKKSDKTRYVVGCIDKTCTFSCRGSVYRDTKMFVVRKFVGVHSCVMRYRHNHNKQATAAIIAKKVLSRFGGRKQGPRAREIQSAMKDVGIDTSYYKANRARCIAQDIIRGTTEESYSKLYSWMFMLERSNPGTRTTVIRDTNQRFKYAFWTLGAWINAVPHLNKVILVDGAHLSGKFSGHLLIATAQDGNKGIYPLAFGVVDSENDASWSFFFNELKAVVPDNSEVVFVSDRHTSIAKGLRRSYTLAGHGHCMFHIYQNFKAKYHRGDLLNLWDKLAKAYTVQEFNNHFAKLSNDAPQVAKYVKDAGFANWARAHFPTNRFNIMTTNSAETINSVYKEERGWPIVAMFDKILQTSASWFCERREDAAKWNEVVTEEITKIIDLRYLSALTMRVHRLSQFEAEVSDGNERFEVNLNAGTCDCRVFQIDKIPWSHAIAVAKNRGVDVADLVNPVYKNEKMKEVYKETIHLVPPFNRWEVPNSISTTTCLPPLVKRKVGRPKINRFKAHWERNWSRTNRCGNYGIRGHSRITCLRRQRNSRPV